MHLSTTQQKIVDAILLREKQDCPGAIGLIGVYGSVLTGDTHEKSDLDLMIVGNEDAQILACGFILDEIGYDIYITSWESLEEDAGCHHARLSKLMDSEIIYAASSEAEERIRKLRQDADYVLSMPMRYCRSKELYEKAKLAYADMLLADDFSKARAHSAGVIWNLLDATMLRHGFYFKLGVKHTLEELKQTGIEDALVDGILDVIRAQSLPQLLSNTRELLRAFEPVVIKKYLKEAPVDYVLEGTYEEMVSNWRHKMTESARNGDLLGAFLNLASFQGMLDDLYDNIVLPQIDVMQDFSSQDLQKNVKAYETGLGEYRKVYDAVPMKPAEYPTIEAFIKDYLAGKI